VLSLLPAPPSLLLAIFSTGLRRLLFLIGAVSGPLFVIAHGVISSYFRLPTIHIIAILECGYLVGDNRKNINAEVCRGVRLGLCLPFGREKSH